MKNIYYLFTILFLLCAFYHLEAKSNNKVTPKLYIADTLDWNLSNKIAKRNYVSIRIDLGLNAPQDQAANLSTSFWGSRGVNVSISKAVQIAQSKFAISYGFGVGHVRFNLDNQHIFAEENGGVVVKNFGDFDGLSMNREKSFLRFKKSIFTQTFLDIPLELQYHGSKVDFRHGFYASLGYKLGLNVSNKMKVQYTADGSEQVDKYKKSYFVNEWRQAMTFRVGWSRFHLFFEYSLTPIFRSNSGPNNSEMKSFLIGVGLADFFL